MRLIVFYFLTIFASISYLNAQDNRKSIINELNKNNVNEGKIKIFTDDFVDNKVGTFILEAENTAISDTSKVIQLSNVQINGFRVQVFAGNNQNKSKEEAEDRQTLINSKFPQHQSYIKYDSPSWRLRVGNFTNRAEADLVLKELKQAFPYFSREMYIVPDVVRKPIYN